MGCQLRKKIVGRPLGPKTRDRARRKLPGSVVGRTKMGEEKFVDVGRFVDVKKYEAKE